MEGPESLSDESSVNIIREVKLEEHEEELRSCCKDDDVWKDTEDVVVEEEQKEDIDEFSVKMFFKGISITDAGQSVSGFYEFGVVMERAINFPVIQVQKKLDFYVQEFVVYYLALRDGLAEVIQNKIRCVFGFTDSELLYDQITRMEKLNITILMALRQRIAAHTSNLESFVLKLVPGLDL